MNFGSLNGFLLFKTIRKDFKRNSNSAELNLARGRRPIGCGGQLRQPAVTASQPDWRSPAAWPARARRGARAARGHRVVATCAAAAWHSRRHLARRPGDGNLVGTACVGRGGGVRHGRTDGDAPRRWCDDGAKRSAQCGAVRRCSRRRMGQRRRR
jgi:hypothetical protein